MKHCARCRKRLPADPARRVYSHFTRSYYCVDLAACERRAKRRRREEVEA